jgi:tRNA nucleotidyltransferase/poly(A) polymerase
MKELGKRLKLSNAEADRLMRWAQAGPVPSSTPETALVRMLYRGDPTAIEDHLRIVFAAARGRAADDDNALVEAGGYSRLLGMLQKWKRPVFPVSGDDLRGLGLEQGKGVGELLAGLESEWIDTGFTLDRDALMARAAEKIADSGS